MIRGPSAPVVVKAHVYLPGKTGRRGLGSAAIRGRKGWGCSRWREGCSFASWFEMAGKRLNEAQARTLVERGKTGVIRGFRAKSGKTFDARLRLDRQTGRVEFAFDHNAGEERGVRSAKSLQRPKAKTARRRP